MPRLLLFLSLLCFTATAQPAWHWAKRDALTSYSINPSYPRQVIAAYNGSSFWGAIQNKKMTYGQLMLGDYKLTIYDSVGNPGTTTNITGKVSLTKAHADPAGNWYVLGFVYDTVQIGSTRIVTAFSNSQYFMARLRAGTLSLDWLTLIGNNQYTSTECFDINGADIYFPVDSGLATRVCRLDAATGTRTTLWTQTGRGYTSYIDADSNGNVYMMGHCVLSGGIDFNGTSSTPPTGMQYPWYIARYKVNGQHHWHYWLGDITCTDRSFILANNNAVFLSGPLMDSTTLAGHHFASPSSLFNADYIIARLDSNGSLIWAQQRPVTSITQGPIGFSTQFHMAAVDTMLYMYLESTGASIWTPGVATQTRNNSHNATLVAYSQSGPAIWAKTVDAIYSTGTQIIADGSSIWVTGVASDSTAIHFDSLQVPTTYTGYIPYFAKMKVAPAKITGPTSVPTSVIDLPIIAYPNPTKTALTIRTRESSTIQIRDLTGRIIWTANTTSHKDIVANTTSWPRGIYLLQSSSPKSKELIRIVLD